MPYALCSGSNTCAGLSELHPHSTQTPAPQIRPPHWSPPPGDALLTHPGLKKHPMPCSG